MQDSSTLKWVKTGFTACSTAFLATLIMGCNPPVEVPDADGDKIPDAIDNCIDVKNPAQTDADKDSIGDFCEQGFEYDFDNDGFTDVAAPGVDRFEDNCPTINDPTNDPLKCLDTDGDGTIDVDDSCPEDARTADDDNFCTDSDNDGAFNEDDVCPEDDRTSTDVGVCTDTDEDLINDAFDNCPNFASTDQNDLDGDGIGNVCDDDRDGDGIANDDDTNTVQIPNFSCADDPASTCNTDEGVVCNDTDGDGFTFGGNDPSCDVDSCPNTPNPGNDPSVCGDSDGDTILNSADNCPDRQNIGQNSAVCADPDSDGFFSAAADNESASDADNCPNDANADQLDFDNDGQGDVCDADADNDGMTAAQEWPGCELDADVDANGWSTCGENINLELQNAHAEWYAQILVHRQNNDSATAAPTGTGNVGFDCNRPGGSGNVAWNISANAADQNFRNCRYVTETSLSNSPGQGIAGYDIRVNGNLAIEVDGTKGTVYPKGSLTVTVFDGIPSFATINNGQEFSYTIFDERYVREKVPQVHQGGQRAVGNQASYRIVTCAKELRGCDGLSRRYNTTGIGRRHPFSNDYFSSSYSDAFTP
jgi:hypothetical protein